MAHIKIPIAKHLYRRNGGREGQQQVEERPTALSQVDYLQQVCRHHHRQSAEQVYKGESVSAVVHRPATQTLGDHSLGRTHTIMPEQYM